MTIDNEKLMHQFVRTGMIMRHIDGEGRCCQGHGPQYGHGPGHGHGEGHGGNCGARAQGKGCGHDAGSREEHAHGPGEGHERRRGQMRVIAMIAMQEGISQKDLAFLLGIRPQTLGEMLFKLEERGLVERKKSEADGRVIEVSLTEEGREMAAHIAERRKLVAADLFSVLSEEEREQLASILDKLTAELDKRHPHRRAHEE